MSKPKLASKTPDATETNSMIDQHDQLIELFKDKRGSNSVLGVVEFTITKHGETSEGDNETVVQVRHVELALSPADAEKAEKLITGIYHKRTGDPQRPANKPQPEPNEPLDGVELENDDV